MATTVAIAVTNSIARNDMWIAVAFGLLGAMFMRLALAAILTEMEYVAKVSRHYAGDDLTVAPVAARSRGWAVRLASRV